MSNILLMMMTLIIFGAIHSASAKTDKLELIISPQDFAECLAKDILKSYNPQQARSYISKALDVQTELANDFNSCIPLSQLVSICRTHGFRSEFAIEYLGCRISALATKEALYHSVSLAHGLSTDGVEGEDETVFQTYLDTLSREQYKRKKDGKPLSEEENFRSIFNTTKKVGSTSESNPTLRHRLRTATAPLIDWLFEQKNHSVAPYDLYLKAREIYKDPMIALAVIGDLFDTEVQFCHISRKHCVLGNRVQPFIKDNTGDPVGWNYHFWAYLNIALASSPIAADTLVIGYEKLYQGDHKDYLVDQAALRVGHNIHRILWSESESHRIKNKTCPLDKN